MLNEGKNVEIKTKNKLLMEHAREHVEVTRGKKEILIKLMLRESTKGHVYHTKC